jgi:hypothetical protein
MNVVSAILWQLTEQAPLLVDLADEAKPNHPYPRKNPLPTQNYMTEDLYELFIHILRKRTQPDGVIIAIDALDECAFPRSTNPFLRFMERLLSDEAHEWPLSDNKRPTLKLLLSAKGHTYHEIVRSHPGLKSAIATTSHFPVINVIDENSSGIRSYTRAQLENWPDENPDSIELRHKLEDAIVDRSHGIFLWTVLVVESLLGSDTSLANLHAALGSLPENNDLFVLLARIVRDIHKANINKASINTARSMITFAITSSRPLSNVELAAFLAVEKSQECSELRWNTPINIEGDVRRLCRSLLFCTQGFIQPFHDMVRKFFHDESCPEEFRITQEDAHGTFAQACLKSLRFMQFPPESGAKAESSLRYAVDNVLYHTMKASGDKQLQLTADIRQILWPRSKFTQWLQYVWDEGEILRKDLVIMQLKSAILKELSELTIPEKVTPAHVVALVVGNDRLFQALVKHEAGGTWFSLQDKDAQDRTALHWAAGQEANTEDEAEIINTMIGCGLGSDEQANNGRSPMHIASQRGRPETIDALEGHGANVNFKDKADLTPLHL